MDPEADYKPFGVVEEDGQTVLRLHGTEEQRAKVEADKVHIIMDAIAQGWDIDIEYADIEGDLGIGEITSKLERIKDGGWLIKDSINMIRCNISGNADFISAVFCGNADFRSAQFSGNASFESAHFSGYTNFDSAHFRGNAYFDSSKKRDASGGGVLEGRLIGFSQSVKLDWV